MLEAEVYGFVYFREFKYSTLEGGKSVGEAIKPSKNFHSYFFSKLRRSCKIGRDGKSALKCARK